MDWDPARIAKVELSEGPTANRHAGHPGIDPCKFRRPKCIDALEILQR